MKLVDEADLRWILTSPSLDLRFQARQCRNPPVARELADCVAGKPMNDCHKRGSGRDRGRA